MKSLSEIQQEQAQWSDRNFGPQSPERMIFGMMEELGELAETHFSDAKTKIDENILYAISLLADICHCHLKRQQGIRGDIQEPDVSSLEASLNGVRHFWYSNEPTMFTPEEPNSEKRKDSWADMMIFGLGYLTAAKLGDASEILNEVWSQVQQRDWVNKKKDGINE